MRRPVHAQAMHGRADTPPLGVHALVFEGGWSREEAGRVIAGSARAGFDLVEVPLLDPDTLDAAMTWELLEEHGLSASASTGLTFETDISSSSADVRAAGKALLTKAMQKAAQFGARHFVGVTYSAMGKYAQPASAEQWQHCVASLKELAAIAADLGLEYGLEVVNRYETNLLNTTAQAMEMIADVGADNMLVHIDTYHCNIEERTMAAAVLACKDRLGYVHIGESHRGYLGTGSVDFGSFFQALAAVDYTGPITFESFSSAVVSPTLSNALCVWRDLWEDSEDLATHAQRYMAAQWHAAAMNRAAGVRM